MKGVEFFILALLLIICEVIITYVLDAFFHHEIGMFITVPILIAFSISTITIIDKILELINSYKITIDQIVACIFHYNKEIFLKRVYHKQCKKNPR